MIFRAGCMIVLFLPALVFANVNKTKPELPIPKLAALPQPSFKQESLRKTKSVKRLPTPLVDKNTIKYAVGAYGSYNYFREKDIETSYERLNSNPNDSIKVDNRLKGFSPVIVAGIQIPLNLEDMRLLDKLFLGLKLFYFNDTVKGKMAIFGLDDYVCDDVVAKVPLRSIGLMLNSRVFINSTVFSLTPFIEAGIGVNFYKTKLKVSGDYYQFDTNIKNNTDQERLYNIGAGLSKELDDGWFVELIYNYYHSPDLKTDIKAKSGLNLASPVKVKFDANNISLGFKKYL